MEKVPHFNLEESPMREAYTLLGATTPLELSTRYSIEDQKLMTMGAWDYENPTLVTNQVKEILEYTPTGDLTEDECAWRNEVLWFWNHHAISCAIWRYGDKKSAQLYSSRALQLQGGDHPNQITRLLYFLVNDRLRDAEDWIGNIADEAESATAYELVAEYRNGEFFTKTISGHKA